MKRTLVWALMLLFGSAAAVYAADAKLPSGDRKFLQNAESGGMAEVQLGQIAEKQAQSQDVKDFGARMASDHQKAGEEVKSLAEQKNAKLSEKTSWSDSSEMKKLSKKNGADFDKEYMRQMMKDHTADVKEFRKAADNAKDPDVKAWASKTLPVLEQHLQQARDIAQKLGVNAG